MSDQRRSSDEIALRTEQKLDDFIDRYERDQNLSKEWRSSFCERLEPLEDMAKKIKTPLQAIGVIMMAILGGLGLSVWKYIERHWNQ